MKTEKSEQVTRDDWEAGMSQDLEKVKEPLFFFCKLTHTWVTYIENPGISSDIF